MGVAWLLLRKARMIRNSLAIPAAGIVTYFVLANSGAVRNIRFQMLDITYPGQATVNPFLLIGVLLALALYLLNDRGVINLRQYLRELI